MIITAGFVIYTAPAASAGNGSFTYTLRDGAGGHTVTGTVTVTAPPSVTPRGAEFVVTFHGVPGGSFRMSYSIAGPSDHTWQVFSPLAVQVPAPNGIFTHTDLNPLCPVHWETRITDHSCPMKLVRFAPAVLLATFAVHAALVPETYPQSLSLTAIADEGLVLSPFLQSATNSAIRSLTEVRGSFEFRGTHLAL